MSTAGGTASRVGVTRCGTSVSPYYGIIISPNSRVLLPRAAASGDTVWHVAAVAGNAEVLEALASHAPALEELEVQQRRLQRQKSSRRRREAASAGRVAPRAELAVAAGAGAVGSGRGSGSGSSGAGGALSEADRASPSQPASPNAAAPSHPDVQRTQSDEQPPQPHLPAQEQADPQLQQQQQASADTPEPAQAARVELLRSVINLRSDKHQVGCMCMGMLAWTS